MQTQNPYQDLIDHLSDDGLATPSAKLDCLLHDRAWTTRSDFLGAFGSEMERIKAGYWDRMSDRTKASFSEAAQLVLRVWPELKL